MEEVQYLAPGQFPARCFSGVCNGEERIFKRVGIDEAKLLTKARCLCCKKIRLGIFPYTIADTIIGLSRDGGMRMTAADYKRINEDYAADVREAAIERRRTRFPPDMAYFPLCTEAQRKYPNRQAAIVPGGAHNHNANSIIR
ncbi:MAG: hypothetical protein A3C04_04020 [Candidatus Wildermuthbacteria bacterium RIFCSPHIGHO2_02_FULL_45_25]|uniref:Uncharacterized protein n=1 Tax=Candidatus Wildermuthbacteria bacterium RIFCSPHIGHO2_02_FULL_45_25 TaxID=1802450 RepID=A0A1G2R114_9BACT|nr:MAG: hypothetical protein A3C04_04020 [Candidatus Wildermuthbacteria bacterium RIFCSPHIGHO2_02_FULL_45_25]